MITRMTIPERCEVMRELREKVQDVQSEIYEVLSERFAPYDCRNVEAGYTAEDAINHTKPYDDKDAPLITRIFKELDKVHDELVERCAELDAEEVRRYEGYEMFYAWDLGLCPYEMREYRRKRTPYAWNSLNWEDIAKYLKGTGMSRKDTAQAVREYLKGKDADGDRVIAVTREMFRI